MAALGAPVRSTGLGRTLGGNSAAAAAENRASFFPRGRASVTELDVSRLAAAPAGFAASQRGTKWDITPVDVMLRACAFAAAHYMSPNSIIIMARNARATPRGMTPSPAAVDAEVRPRGRPPVISTERLLEVAREVFLELGIRATTAEVASRARVAEGTIFHRFKSKEELFRAAMQFDPERGLAFVERLPERAGQGDLRTNLIEFAEEFMLLVRVAMPVMMMSWSNPEGDLCGGRSAEKAERYRRVVRAISAFFEAEMAAGRLSRKNPEVLARMLLGSVHHYCMSELFAWDVGGLSLSDFASEVVDVLLAAGGAMPSNAKAGPGRAGAAVGKKAAAHKRRR
jgi:AcrR family transcriptional regulator